MLVNYSDNIFIVISNFKDESNVSSLSVIVEHDPKIMLFISLCSYFYF